MRATDSLLLMTRTTFSPNSSLFICVCVSVSPMSFISSFDHGCRLFVLKLPVFFSLSIHSLAHWVFAFYVDEKICACLFIRFGSHFDPKKKYFLSSKTQKTKNKFRNINKFVCVFKTIETHILLSVPFTRVAHNYSGSF